MKNQPNVEEKIVRELRSALSRLGLSKRYKLQTSGACLGNSWFGRAEPRAACVIIAHCCESAMSCVSIVIITSCTQHAGNPEGASEAARRFWLVGENTRRPASASCCVFSPPLPREIHCDPRPRVAVYSLPPRGYFDRSRVGILIVCVTLLRPEPLSVALDAAICILSRASGIFRCERGTFKRTCLTNHNVAHFGWRTDQRFLSVFRLGLQPPSLTLSPKTE
jgi:hypothetical protein